ncbi:MAG: glutamate-5-semialdehyde dehydrogenase [Syntrophomonadaceae bacterium]|jgi:glutamate-5-semialdehyde dehydrogenase|nr:glutamate-5-semialdehyde dehydrogenase [Syntrophomonadaceae bacterium]
MNNDLGKILTKQGELAKKAARVLAVADTNLKNDALSKMAEYLEKAEEEIIAANAADIKLGKEMGLTAALLERLMLDKSRIKAMADGLREIMRLPDPVGEVLSISRRPNGLEVGRIRTPIGVIGIIYESRPNVTADAAGLCLKAGNAILLRGGEEAINSNRIIARVISEAAVAAGLPQGTIQLVDSLDRQLVIKMMQMNDYLDCLIPRGGMGLKKAVIENATVPYIMTGMGNCHVYVDKYADLKKARAIVMNAKVQRPSVCNAAETLLVHKAVAKDFLPQMCQDLMGAGVEIRGCPVTQAIASGVIAATEADWDEEYLDLIIAVKVVEDLEEAINHINEHGTGHSEAVISENYTDVRRFMNAVDAAAVYANVSTRFTDGNEFGFGAEMGISTQKLHARGPMGLRELTTTKFIIYGDGQIR